MTPVCIGHSHSACIEDAARETGAALDVLNFWHLPGAILNQDGERSFAPYVQARLHAPTFSCVGGAVHYDIGLVLHPTPFDFVDPSAPEEALIPDAELIPYGAIRHALEIRTAPYLRIMDLVRECVSGDVFHLQSPPVFEAETIQEHDPGWVAFYGQGCIMAPAPFRRKLWRLHSDIVARHCTATGIVFVPCPPGALTPDGYLRPGLNGRPAHTNAAYGALVLGPDTPSGSSVSRRLAFLTRPRQDGRPCASRSVAPSVVSCCALASLCEFAHSRPSIRGRDSGRSGAMASAVVARRGCRATLTGLVPI